MTNENLPFHNHIKISDKEFAKLGEYIHSHYGIKMPPIKKTMLESRLQKRLRTLGLKTFSQYSKLIFSPDGAKSELQNMLDMVTTNKTDFFREPAHFTYLTDHALTDIINKSGAGIRRPLKVWSAGCSTGEEPYTLAMVLSEYAKKHGNFRFEITATDLSMKVLNKAIKAVYDENKVEPVPLNMKKEYLLRSKDRLSHSVRIVPKLRSLISFNRVNFMDDNYGIQTGMDIIFCRNVIIYFDRDTQEKLLNHLSRHLAPDGYIFMGHSETLSGLKVPLRSVAPTIYVKDTEYMQHNLVRGQSYAKK